MISYFRTALTMVTVAIVTVIYGAIVIFADLLGVPRKPGGVYEKIPCWWAHAILWAAGVRIVVHDLDRRPSDGPCIFTANHFSLFDIPALMEGLPRHFFVAKSELFRIPVFGRGIRAIGTIPIERANQKAAFGAYAVAADRIRSGSSVVIFPEGTRGMEYTIRPFKKGPFVLAIQAGVPIVPCVIYGTIEILPKKSLRLHPGRVDVYLLDPIPTAGYTYDDREALAALVNERMAAKMQALTSSHS